jgi:hypothetical protein
LSTTSNNALRNALVLICLLPLASFGQETELEFGGHVKTRLSATAYPGDSAFHTLTGSGAGSLDTEIRMNLEVGRGPWSLDGAWQVYGTWGDNVELLREIGGGGFPGFNYLPNDDRRLMNLTDVIYDKDRFAALHRLDRLAVSYTSDKFVVRVGRQAISWGNGLIFSPMDIVNPFDPTAVDTEYKAGDDMVYAQYLRDNGDDFEFAHVVRRNPATGDVEADEATTALKYHGFAGEGEYDILVAEHYGDTTIAIGGNRSIGGAIVHGDVVWIDTPSGSRTQLVTNLSYSWVWGGKNMSGIVEYYFSEFGQRSGQYDLASLLGNPELLRRLERGETFTLGRNYLAGGITVEMTPLWMLTPNLFANLDDGSALLQVVSRSSLSDNAEILAALNLPLGPNGSEFGGIETTIPGAYLSTDFSVFVQFGWYF